MRYVFIDESGNLGELGKAGSSDDFCMAACICQAELAEFANKNIMRFLLKIKKKEIKFSKLSSAEAVSFGRLLRNVNIEHVCVYAKKVRPLNGRLLLENVFRGLIESLNISKDEKVKVFVDGVENAYFRKIYEPIIKKRFPRSTLKFANSLKTPMIQAADFYAGKARRSRGKG